MTVLQPQALQVAFKGLGLTGMARLSTWLTSLRRIALDLLDVLAQPERADDAGGKNDGKGGQALKWRCVVSHGVLLVGCESCRCICESRAIHHQKANSF